MAPSVMAPFPPLAGPRMPASSRRRLLVLGALATLLLGGCARQQPPPELTQLRAVADPLLRANRIRTSPIRFSLEAGESAGYWARQLGLCRPAPGGGGDPDQDCEAWNHASPDDIANPLQRQVNRLAYLFGTASARTYPQGLISFDRSFFLVQGHNNDALRCVVAHELTHFLHRHAYLSSRREQQSDLRGLSEPQQARDLAQLSQQQELAADRGALLMTSIAGHDPDACIRQLQEAAELDGDYSPDDPGGTHPGHGRRIAAARAYLRQGLQGDLAAWRKLPAGRPVVPRWSWDGADRLLTATTRP